MRRRLLYITLSLAMMISLAACGTLDIIGDYSIKSFQSVLTAMEDQVTQDPRFEGWSLAAPDKKARVVWSRDYSKTAPDLFMEVEALPFMEAGLDTSKLPEGMFVDGKIIVGIELGSDALPDKVDGWVFATVETMDEKGKDVQVDKFLKPFNLEIQ